MPGGVDGEMLGVGVHAVDLLLDLLGGVGEVDAVAQRLAHLGLAVGARQTLAYSRVGQQYLRLHQRGAVDVVEAVDNLACKLNHRRLIVAGRHGRCLEGGDVGGLAYRITEESHRERLLEAAHLYFGLHRGVALHTRHRHQVHIIERQFTQLRHLSLHEERALLRVKTDGKIVKRHLYHILTHLLRIVGIIGQRLRVSDEDENLVEFA